MADKKSVKRLKASSLAFVEISEIRDSVLVLREGQMRGVLAVSSANFALKSGQEQQVIINTFQGILNSLEFPIHLSSFKSYSTLSYLGNDNDGNSF